MLRCRRGANALGSAVWPLPVGLRKCLSTTRRGTVPRGFPHPSCAAIPWSGRSELDWECPGIVGRPCDRLSHLLPVRGRRGLRWSRARFPGSFDSHGFCEVSRLIHVCALGDGGVIRQKLRRNCVKDRCQDLWAVGHFERQPDVIGHLL